MDSSVNDSRELSEVLHEYPHTCTAYPYDPLPRSRRLIRLLRLLPNELSDAGVVCTLVTPSEQERHQYPYEALSWCWGTAKKTDHITIHHNGKEYVSYVSSNLKAALQALRYPRRSRYLWIDMICINQDDLNEKNHQVEMMDIIYRDAERVCVWLGPADQSSREAFRFILVEILQLQHSFNLQDKSTNCKKLLAFIELAQKPWFSRRWVIQELALARNAIIYCGDDRISWKDFTIAIRLLVEAHNAMYLLSEVIKQDLLEQYTPSYFEHLSAIEHLPATLLIDSTERMFQCHHIRALPNTSGDLDSNSFTSTNEKKGNGLSKSDDENYTDNVRTYPRTRLQPLLSLEYLVSTLTTFEATLPHDTIYALLAIAKDTTAPVMMTHARFVSGTVGTSHEDNETYMPRPSYNVDYKLPYVDVCKDFIQFAIVQALDSNASRALDVIFRPWAVEEKELQKMRDAKQKRNRRAYRQDSRVMISHLQADDTSSTITDPFQSASVEEKAFKFESIKLPSWVPQLSNAPFAREQSSETSNPRRIRINADPLVGLPNPVQQNYAASGTKSVDMKSLRFRKCLATKQFSMYVRGFQLDVIAEVAQAAHHGHVPTSWADLADWKNAEELPPARFWRTLVADRASNGFNPPYYFLPACRECFNPGSRVDQTIDTTELIKDAPHTIVAQFCRRVQAVTWNRSLVRTEGEKLGMVDKDVQKGDRICILYGCSVPVVLRESPRKTEQEFEAELGRELESVNNTIVKAVLEYIKRTRRQRIWKDKEMAKLCRMWLETTGYIHRHRSEPGYFPITESRPADQLKSRSQRVEGLKLIILKKIIADFKTWCVEERKKAWLITKNGIEAEMGQRNENPKTSPSRMGKEMDAHLNRLADQATEVRTSRKRKRVQLQPVTHMPGISFDTSVPEGGVDSGVLKEASAVLKKKSLLDWWEIEYALVASRHWKQKVRKSKEAREEKWRLQRLENCRALKNKNVTKGSGNADSVPMAEDTAVGEGATRNEDGVSTEHLTEGPTGQDETTVTDAENDNGVRSGNEEHDQAMGDEKPDSGDHETRDDHLKDYDILLVDARSSNSAIPDAHAPTKIRPSWHRKIERTRLTVDEAEEYDHKVKKNLRERLGEEGYYSYTLLGECYIHGTMDGEAMRHRNGSAEGVLPSMVFEIR